jgi:O-antigen ligase
LLGNVIALISLVITPGVLFYFDITPKIVLLFAGTAAALIWVAFSGISITGKSKTFTIFSGLLLLNVVSLAVSTAISTRPGLSVFGSNWRRFGSVAQVTICLLAWLVAIGCAGRPNRVRTVLRSVSVAGAVSAAYGILQYLGWDPLLPVVSYQVASPAGMLIRPPGTLGYSSYFATWLLFVVFLSLALRVIETSSAWRRLAAAAAIAASCAVLLTGTRAALLGLVAGAVVWKIAERSRISRRGLIFAAVTTGLLAVFLVAPVGKPLRARIRWSSQQDPWGGARLALWRDSFGMAAQRPVAGYGPEMFTGEFPRFESTALAASYPDFAHESPHNIFLDTFVAQGAPGLVLLGALWALGLVLAWRLKQPAFAGALVAGLVAQQFIAFTGPTAVIFLVTLGLLVALDTQKGEPKRRAPFVAISVAIAAALVYGAIRLATADHALALTKQRIDEADVAAASEQYHIYERWRLPGGSADVWYSRALLALSAQSPQPQVRREAAALALSAAMRGTETAEDPFNAWYNLAIVCGRREDGACVDRALQASIAAHPRWFKPHWTLAQVLFVKGRMEDALREATIAAELDGHKHREVSGSLEGIRGKAMRARMLQP